jgi:hypothetical protein
MKTVLRVINKIYQTLTIPYDRITPELILRLDKNEIFVFGSNTAGVHAGGAAKLANDKFGAVWGQGEGYFGRTYAIPTLEAIHGKKINNVQLSVYVDKFVAFAKTHKEKIFYVTKIGCGIAGFKVEEIAPFFEKAVRLNNVYLPIEFWNEIKKIPKIKL